MSVVGRAISGAGRAFGKFWWEFLIGDAPELLIAALVVVGLAFALRHDRVAAIVMLPMTVAVVLIASTWHGRRRAPSVADPTIESTAPPVEGN